MSSLRIIGQTISRNLALWFTSVVLLTTMYYVALMIALIVRFQRLPNYANLYDWIFSIQHIWQSTPSSIDALTIMKDEWLLEVGFMNYDFGFGISEWSLFIAPFKVLGIMVLSGVIAANYLLLRNAGGSCSSVKTRFVSVTTGFGATFVSLASITMSWVVCCSTPTWIVGLAIMGLGVSTSLWLEPVGIWVTIFGYGFLLISLFLAASLRTGAYKEQHLES
jgi:hypothetical protein